MQEDKKVADKNKPKNKQFRNRLPREALDTRVTDEEMEFIKMLRRTKGVVANIAVLNDPITELAMELEPLFRAQRRIKGDPLGQRNLSTYKKAVEAAKTALTAIREVNV